MNGGWREFLGERPIGVLATVGADGTPHAVPVELIVRDGRAYVWCRSDSVKARNAARAGRAALTAYKGAAGVLVRGPVRLIRDGETGYAEIAGSFLEKYHRDEMYGNDLVIEIAPERVSEWT
ncbi:MAG: pyridoxamine 5'-phosphate oxidase family protein [Acidobacteria bacterium]|nr:pyridoxamine 5'-phosphate oxidase family protein [Acidobacteriota bacterium]